MQTAYTPEFYSGRDANSYRSARVILPIVTDLLSPNSIVDVGCGAGTWLAVADEQGVTKAVGLEGPWISNVKPFKPGLDIRVHDLETPFKIAEKFDLAICLEVAEHLSPDRSASLVSNLCQLSEHVLFGAAVPGQPGLRHINCRWQSYWAGLFRAEGRVAIDAIRPAVWGHDEVRYWYQQNTLLYVPQDKVAAIRSRLTEREVMYDIVHPTMVPQDEATFRDLLSKIPGAFMRAVRRRLTG